MKMSGPGSAIALLCALVLPTLNSALAASKQPNIILFLVDDMGWMDSETYGSAFYETPALNRLAKEGMLFTQAYAQPLCSPSRAALMTGKYPARLHMHQAITGASKPEPKVPSQGRPTEPVLWPESRSRLPLEEQTIAEALQQRGYQTWFLGKWHLGSSAAFYPDHQGFDKLVGVGGAGPRGGYFAPNAIPRLQPGPAGEYICERLTDEACDLMEHRGDQPFFMYLAHFNVHAPYEAKPEFVARFAGQIDPDSPQQNPVMAAMLYAMDESLGRLLDKLDELQIADDTYVVFMSDNGGVHWDNMKGEYARKYPGPVTSNEPLRGGKACFYEGGVRVPMVVRRPGAIAAHSRESTPVHAVDLYPTLLEIAGGSASGDQVLDGVSLLPVLHQTGALERDTLFCHFPRAKTLAGTVGGSFVWQGDYKLIRLWFAGPRREHEYELYDLSKDISEANNLASAQPQRVEQMAALLDQWLAETKALLPVENPSYDPNAPSRPDRQRRGEVASEGD